MGSRSSFSSLYARVKSGETATPAYVPAPPSRGGGQRSARVEDEGTWTTHASSSAREDEPHLSEEPVLSSENYFGAPRLLHDDEEEKKDDAAASSSSAASSEERGRQRPPPRALPPTKETSSDSQEDKAMSLSSLELGEAELCQRLSAESRSIFEDDVAKDALAEGWQRYSVSFGAGRMGIEFEWDGKSTRRLVVTRVGKEASGLGVRAKDVLIGVGARPIPRATDPIAVHKHLLSCARPVVLHFYRVVPVERVSDSRRPTAREDDDFDHQTASDDQTTTKKRSDSVTDSVTVQNETPRSRIAVLASAVWDRLPALSGSRGEEEQDLEKPPEPSLARVPSELGPPPPIVVDPERYTHEDDSDEEEDHSRRWTCLLGGSVERKSLLRSLKPVLRPKPWVLQYDSVCDGMCLEALYNRAALAPKGPQLLLVRDDQLNVAGAFVDEKIRNVGNYFGTGECFVFELNGAEVKAHRWVGPGSLFDDRKDDPDDDPAASRDDAAVAGGIYNDMFVYASNDLLGFGSGGGGFAIRIDEALEFGASRPCATYGNTASLFAGRDTFPVQRVQLYSFAQFAFY